MRLVCILFLIFTLHLGAETFVMPEDPVVVLETKYGIIELRLFPAVAPKAVENFIRLAESDYYTNTIFHRVVPRFVIQGGDPTGKGTGGESIWGKPFEDEFDPNVNFDRPGLLGMANSGPNTNGSQFFITTVPTPWLNQKHTLFGEVISGMDVVHAIENAPQYWFRPTSPKEPQVILRAYLQQEYHTCQ